MWISGTPSSILQSFGDLAGLISEIDTHSLSGVAVASDVDIEAIGIEKANEVISEYIQKAYSGLNGETVTSFRDKEHLIALQDEVVEVGLMSTFVKLQLDQDPPAFVVERKGVNSNLSSYNAIFI